jgi:hypothetical protein
VWKGEEGEKGQHLHATCARQQLQKQVSGQGDNASKGLENLIYNPPMPEPLCGGVVRGWEKTTTAFCLGRSREPFVAYVPLGDPPRGGSSSDDVVQLEENAPAVEEMWYLRFSARAKRKRWSANFQNISISDAKRASASS